MIINFMAPGGVGKSAVIRALLEMKDSPFSKPISYTSRSPRMGEVDGVDYYFRTKDEVLNMVDKIAVHLTVEGVVYANSVSTFRNKKEILLTTLRPKGIQELEKIIPDILVIHLFISESERVDRMKVRGDSDLEIEKRIKRDQLESTELKTTLFKSRQFWVNCSKPVSDVVKEIVKIIKTK